jgi:hypothetical protein
MLKPRRKVLAKHVACTGATENAYNIFLWNFEKNKPLGITRSIQGWKDNLKLDWQFGLDSSGYGKGQIPGSTEHSNEPSGSLVEGLSAPQSRTPFYGVN